MFETQVLAQFGDDLGVLGIAGPFVALRAMQGKQVDELVGIVVEFVQLRLPVANRVMR